MKTKEAYQEGLRTYLVLKNYSAATVSAYGCAFRQFLDWRSGREYGEDFTPEQARQYLLYRYEQGLKWQTINGDYSAMQKFYIHVLKQEWDVNHIPRPRKELSLPTVLSTQEVQRLIEHGRTFKHQVFMTLIYATGLRLSEALNLKITAIDSDRMQLRVVKGKGAKDRYVAMPDCLLELLRTYYKTYRPQGYLFNGKYKGSRWANRSAQHAIECARTDAGIGRAVSPHVLRHCYATHHLESGTNLVFLKAQLGHKNLKTTARYIHLCQSYQPRVKHPLAEMSIRYAPSTASESCSGTGAKFILTPSVPSCA
jgi:site-specific recombinase XerD